MLNVRETCAKLVEARKARVNIFVGCEVGRHNICTHRFTLNGQTFTCSCDCHEIKRTYYEMQNVGRAKYLINFHDGIKTHSDGSKFYDIRIFRNRRQKDAFVETLKAEGYQEIVT